MNMKEKIIDVDYTTEDANIVTNELDKNKVYYTIGQVAKMLNVTESKLRYWTNFFALDSNDNDLIKVSYSNKNRAYTLDNINKLKRMKELVDQDGMTLQQAKDYTTVHGFNKDLQTIEQDNPLALAAFVSELTNDINTKLEQFQTNLLDQIKNMIDENNNNLLSKSEENNKILKQELVILSSEIISENTQKLVEEQIDEHFKNQNDKLDEFLIETKKRYDKETELLNNLRLKMDERKKESEEKKNKGLFSKFKWSRNK